MRGRVTIAAILLLAVLIGGLLMQRHTVAVCREIAELLVEDRFDESYRLWQQKAQFFAALTRHDRVDAVSQCFARASAFRRSDTEDEYRAECENALMLLALLAQYDRPGVRSLF